MQIRDCGRAGLGHAQRISAYAEAGAPRLPALGSEANLAVRMECGCLGNGYGPAETRDGLAAPAA
jgi:hypothetical protein